MKSPKKSTQGRVDPSSSSLTGARERGKTRVVPRSDTLAEALMNLQAYEYATYSDRQLIAPKTLVLLKGVIRDDFAKDELSRRILGILGGQEYLRKKTPPWYQKRR